MIERAAGNLLTADVDALVNTVNCVGFMGKGIALQFKKAFPDNFKAYRRACEAEEVRPGRMFVYETGALTNPRFIINFPTKRHWRGDSRLEDIRSGLAALIDEVRTREIQTIAVPPLGCGHGGLDWRVVRPLIEEAFSEVPDVLVKLYEPLGAPEATQMPVGTKRPHLTVARALFLRLMARYQQFAYRLTLLEIQKLAYFLQECGEPLKLRYDAGHYGPYAPNLNKVLEALEGHYTRGYGDSQKPDIEIGLLPGAAEEADRFLQSHPASLERLEKLALLIDGFETPYGMELLSSVHWVASKGEQPAQTAEEAICKVRAWNDRKRRMFSVDHIAVAWERLVEDGLIRSSPRL
ncbi:MAG: macro domain-containing protein [Candidatus Sumerlaeia bacterium]|nr:macro domain-containing protein [Candidatus Sumerlaeia bacterium]